MKKVYLTDPLKVLKYLTNTIESIWCDEYLRFSTGTESFDAHDSGATKDIEGDLCAIYLVDEESDEEISIHSFDCLSVINFSITTTTKSCIAFEEGHMFAFAFPENRKNGNLTGCLRLCCVCKILNDVFFAFKLTTISAGKDFIQ